MNKKNQKAKDQVKIEALGDKQIKESKSKYRFTTVIAVSFPLLPAC